MTGVNDDAVLEVRDLRCGYGSFEAVRGLTFHVQKGELFALLGTNGAGKTTALETLEGHRRPSSGRVRLFGLDPVQDRARIRPRVGMMLQESGFAGELTVAETVRMWGRLRTDRTDVAAALSLVDLAHRADVRVQALSGGERRRLDFALACLGDPELLFLDEPTTGLDPESRNRVLSVVAERVAAGTAVVLTTHYLEEAERLAHRIGIMRDGKLRVLGTREEVLERQPAVIRFRLPGGWPPPRGFPPLAGRLSATAEGLVTVQTQQLQQDLTAAMRWADEEGVVLRDLIAKHASLEDVFATVSRGELDIGGEQAPLSAVAAAAC